jgi:hypothetical protein
MVLMNKGVFVVVVGMIATSNLWLYLIPDEGYRMIARGGVSVLSLLLAPKLWALNVLWTVRTLSRGDAAIADVLSDLEQRLQQGTR